MAEHILDGDKWLDVIDNSEMGEEILAPLGLHPFIKGVVTLVGAETSVGKTAYGLQCFRWVLELERTAAYCTLEMSPPLLFNRFWPQFGSEENCRNWIKDKDAKVSQSYLDYQEVETILRQGYDFVVLDHIHELPFDGHEELAKKVHRIAALAPETNTAILMLAQMKQRDPTFDTGPPQIYDFSYTKALPEVAGIAQAIWRPDPDVRNEVELVTLKNRFAPPQDPVSLKLTKEITFERSW